MSDDMNIPSIADLLWPVLKSAHELGGSAVRSELMDHVVGAARITDKQIAEVYPGPTGKSIALHRLEWAIYWLKAIKVLDSSKRGVYTISSDANNYFKMDEDVAVIEIQNAYEAARKEAGRKAAAKRTAKEKSIDKDDVDPVPEDDWKSTLLDTLKTIKPDGFERLAKLLLREAGFQKVVVLGRIGDQGLDGIGVYRMSLLSFPIYFQCKRYAGSVGADAVRDFRGAMAGRGEKGLLITTGTFTPAARSEATRDGAPPVDLVEGDVLCDLIADYGLGVKVTERSVRDVEINHKFFSDV